MAVSRGFFAANNYFGVLTEERLENKNPNREERKRGPTLNPAMKDENFIRDLKEWSRDYGNPRSDDYIPFHEFLDRYPKYFPKSTGTGQIPVENCHFEPEWFTYPPEVIDMTIDKLSASSLPSRTYFGRCKFVSKNDVSTFVFTNNILSDCEFVGNFDGAEISHCMMRSIDYTRASLRGSHFKKSRLTGVDFSGTSLHASTFNGATVIACNFANANLEGAKAINNSEFTASNFQQANMRYFHLGSGPVNEKDLDRSSIKDCDLTGASLKYFEVYCGAVLEPTVFNATSAAEAAELYMSYFPADTNCLLPHIGTTCTDLYDDRVHEMVNVNGDSNLICTNIMPASSCGSDVKHLAFKAGTKEQDSVPGMVSYANPATLYGQPGYDADAVRNALNQEGMKNVFKTTQYGCTHKAGVDAALWTVFGVTVGVPILFCIVYGLYQGYQYFKSPSESGERESLVAGNGSRVNEQAEPPRSNRCGRRC